VYLKVVPKVVGRDLHARKSPVEVNHRTVDPPDPGVSVESLARQVG